MKPQHTQNKEVIQKGAFTLIRVESAPPRGMDPSIYSEPKISFDWEIWLEGRKLDTVDTLDAARVYVEHVQKHGYKAKPKHRCKADGDSLMEKVGGVWQPKGLHLGFNPCVFLGEATATEAILRGDAVFPTHDTRDATEAPSTLARSRAAGR